MSALALDDRVNPEAAGNIRAAAAEDTVLGLMLLYEEHRRAVREGAVSPTADDFVTAFNRRVFEAIMELENSDGGFSTAVLGEKFDPTRWGVLPSWHRHGAICPRTGSRFSRRQSGRCRTRKTPSPRTMRRRRTVRSACWRRNGRKCINQTVKKQPIVYIRASYARKPQKQGRETYT